MSTPSLDPQQHAAATAQERTVLCLAGAGAGKTRVLVERVAHLVENCKVSPSEILTITFTRKAAGELKERLVNRIGNAAYRVEAGTIHAVALRLLMRFGELIGYKPGALTVYSEWESTYLLRECAMDLGIYNGKAWKVPKKDVDAMFMAYYSRGEEPAQDHDGYKLFCSFMQRCRENNSMTYGGILLGLRMLLPKIAGYLPWKHLLIDETQDNDLLQWELVLTLRDLLGASLFAVGDVDQSIYKFRGATPEWLVQNADRFDAVYPIENNYRSAPQIVEAANRLIEVNTERLPKTMRPARPATGFVKVESGMDSENIADLVGRFTLPDELHGASDAKFSDVAVLARTHILLESLSERMVDLDIPHRRVGEKTALTNSAEFRRFHAFLKLLVNPYDNFAFLLIRELVGLDREEYNAIRLAATQRSRSHFQAWMDADGGDPATWIEWFSPIPAAGELYAPAVIDTLRAGLDDAWTGDPIGLHLSSRFALDWFESNPRGTIADYLAWLATYDLQDEIDEDDSDVVTLMTIHAAKGLEWPLVIVAGCNEGILPSKRCKDEGDVEDERRLMYVAMTRARDGLVLAVRPTVKEDARGKVYDNPVSRFVAECQA